MKIKSYLAAFTLLAIPGGSVIATQAVALEQTQKSLYDRLGGYAGVSAVVDEFADRLFRDPKIEQFFAGMGDDTRASFKQKNKNLVCAATGGPCKIISRNADVVHGGLGITSADFNVVAGHLKDVLVEFNVPEAEQDELFAIILSLKPAIVDRPEEMKLSKDAPVDR